MHSWGVHAQQAHCLCIVACAALRHCWRQPQLTQCVCGVVQEHAGQGFRRGSFSSSDGSVPDEFMDPIMMTPMSDPVVLPDSKAVIDRSTAIRHLLSSPTDPFTRTPLSLEDLQEDPALHLRITTWRSK